MDTEICVADTTGELQRLTQVADAVFVGKSLPPHTEGQTPIEAAGLGRALVFGPGMSSFRAIAHDLVSCGAAEVVADAAELEAAWRRLLRDETLREGRAEAGRRWHQSNRGALRATLEAIKSQLNHS
jgi:3-deoxy-D-manno-octulosonic-acid transferase